MLLAAVALNPVPVMMTVVPTGPLSGVTFVIEGVCAVAPMVKSSKQAVIIAWKLFFIGLDWLPGFVIDEATPDQVTKGATL